MKYATSPHKLCMTSLDLVTVIDAKAMSSIKSNTFIKGNIACNSKLYNYDNNSKYAEEINK